MEDGSQARPRWLALLGAWVLSTSFYAVISIGIHYSFVVTGFDNAITEQVVARLAHFEAPLSEVEGHGINYFGDHFSPILGLYAPFYRLFPGPETLFIVQAGVLGLSVVVVLVSASRHLGERTGAWVAVLYALSFGIVNSILASARETPFAVLFLAIAGSAYLDRSVRGIVAASLALLLVKEDSGLVVAAIGAVLVLEARTRRAGFALMGIGALSFVVVLGVVIPLFSASGGSPHTSSPSSMAGAVGAGLVLKLFTVALTFAVLGFISLRSKWSCATMPTFMWRFVSAKSTYWTPFWHYSAPLMPIVFAAGIAAMRDAPLSVRRRSIGIGVAVTALTLSMAVQVHGGLVLSAFREGRPDAADRVLATLPSGARVVSDEYLISHLAQNHVTYYMVEFQGCPKPEFVVAYVGRPQRHIWGGAVETTRFDSVTRLRDFADETYGGRHDVFAEADGYVALKRTPDVPDRCAPDEPEVPHSRSGPGPS